MIVQVTEAETDKVYSVRSKCHRCWKDNEPEGMWVFNKNSGMLHAAGGHEFTACGIEATDDKWLWQL